jgi:hypothetical protein
MKPLLVPFWSVAKNPRLQSRESGVKDSESPFGGPPLVGRGLRVDALARARGREPLGPIPALARREHSRPVPKRREPQLTWSPAQQRVSRAAGPARAGSSPAPPDRSVASFAPTQHRLQIASSRGPPIVGARFPPLSLSQLFTQGEEDFHCGIRNESLTTCFGKSRVIRRKSSITQNGPENAAYSMLRDSVVQTYFSRVGDM